MKTTKARYTLPVPTPEGDFTAHYSRTGLCALDFPGSNPAAKQSHSQLPAKVRRWHAAVVKALAEALAGQQPDHLPPLDLSSGTHFQQAVWRMLVKIKCGETWSYSELARALGRPGAARAVGGACGTNPVPVLVPCHRVLAAGKKLGGFSAGLKWKRLLLAREGMFPSDALKLKTH